MNKIERALKKKAPEELYSAAGLITAELLESGADVEDMLLRYRNGEDLEDLEELLNDSAIMENVLNAEQVTDKAGCRRSTMALVFAMHLAVPCPHCGHLDPQDWKQNRRCEHGYPVDRFSF